MPTFYREGSDLDAILDELDAEYPDQIHINDVVNRRDGGVLGFFAHRRVGVHYTVRPAGTFAEQTFAEESSAGEFDRPPRPAAERPQRSMAAADPLENLIEMAEAAEAAHRARLAAAVVESGQPIAIETVVDDEATNVEFARMLLELATQKATERQIREQSPELAPDPPALPSRPCHPPALPTQPALPIQPAPAIAPTPAAIAEGAMPHRHDDSHQSPPEPRAADPDEFAGRSRRRPVGAHRAAENDDDQTTPSPVPSGFADANPLVLRRHLVELGVPVDWIPGGSGDPYWVAGQLVGRLPDPPVLDLDAGQVLAIAGPGAAALRAARHLASRLRMDPQSVRLAGSSFGDPSTGPRIDYDWQARDFVADVQRTRTGGIVVIPTDDVTEDASSVTWAARMVAALDPSRLWLVVDAAWKSADTMALMAQIGPVEALVVVGAARTTSPASVWQLPKPIAMLDVQFATRGAWMALLIDKLTRSA